jgi:putative DNA primase/helicase
MSGHLVNVFAETAPAYYEKGLPVIPLYSRDKRPIPTDWSRFHAEDVPIDMQQQWLEHWPDANIGLVLGQQSGLIMLDIDTTDTQLLTVIQKMVPFSPWRRVGQKGMVLAFKYTGNRTFRVRNTSGETICELLAERTQCVLPPSIHPKTQEPYYANTNLLDVLDQVVPLPADFEQKLRSALQAAGVQLSHSGSSRVTDFVSAGSRDVQMTATAGLFAYAVMKGERSLKEAIGMLKSFHVEFVEKVSGDDVPIDKHVSNLVKFLTRDVIERGKVLPAGWDVGLTQEEFDQLDLVFSVDHQEKSYEELKDILRDAVENNSHDAEKLLEAVEEVLFRISQASQMGSLHESMLLQYIIEITPSLKLKMSVLKARLREMQRGTLRGQDHTEIAQALISKLEELYLLRHHSSLIWKWTGSHWETLADNEVLAMIANNYGHLDACRRASDHRGILTVIKTLLQAGLVEIDIRGVNFANGFLTEELKLVEHQAEFGMTYTLPFRYLEEAVGEARQFQEFLASSWEQDSDYMQKLDALQEAICVTLFGMGPTFQRAVLLQGAPATGKTQLLRIISALVPDNARSSVPPNEWGDRFMPAMLASSVLNVCGELPEKKLIDGQKFKDIVDGSEQPGQFKGKDIFYFSPKCAHWFASNHYPRTRDTSNGFNRRWLVLTFNKVVPKEERKLDLGDMIVAEEREAIVAWAVQSMMRLKAVREFTLPESHQQAIREIASMNNSVRFFVQESGKVMVSNKGEITETKAYNEYWAFCAGPGGTRPVDATDFRSKMRELGTELGFQLEIKDSKMGGQFAAYRGLVQTKG